MEFDLKKLKKSLKETDKMLTTLRAQTLWLAAEYKDENWVFVYNVYNIKTKEEYVPVFTSPAEFDDEYFNKYSMVETDLTSVCDRLLNPSDCGIVINPFTDKVIIPSHYLNAA